MALLYGFESLQALSRTATAQCQNPAHVSGSNACNRLFSRLFAKGVSGIFGLTFYIQEHRGDLGQAYR